MKAALVLALRWARSPRLAQLTLRDVEERKQVLLQCVIE